MNSNDVFEKAYDMLEKRDATIRQQAAEIERLREALRPFVEYVPDDMREGKGVYRLEPCDGVGGGWFHAGDFRRARKALEDTQ